MANLAIQTIQRDVRGNDSWKGTRRGGVGGVVFEQLWVPIKKKKKKDTGYAPVHTN